MEKEAEKAGCAESVLFVTNDNEVANALYEKADISLCVIWNMEDI